MSSATSMITGKALPIELFDTEDNTANIFTQQQDSVKSLLWVETTDSRVSSYRTMSNETVAIGRTSYDIKPLSECTWEEAKRIAAAGVAEYAWALGDRYPITINTTVSQSMTISGTYYAYIIGFNHNKEIEGNNTVTFQLAQTEDFTHVAFFQAPMNTTDVTSGGWASSYCRNTVLSKIYTALPEDLKSVIRTTVKYTDNAGGGTNTAGNVTTSEDTLFLLSEYEVLGRRVYANTAEQNYQKQYEYYKGNVDLKRYKHNDPTSSWAWWTRSTYATQATRFRSFDSSGNPGSNIATSNYGIAPAFNI